jgi:hypothetical protein
MLGEAEREDGPEPFFDEIGHFVADEFCMIVCRRVGSPSNAVSETVRSPRWSAEDDVGAMTAQLVQEHRGTMGEMTNSCGEIGVATGTANKGGPARRRVKIRNRLLN